MLTSWTNLKWEQIISYIPLSVGLAGVRIKIKDKREIAGVLKVVKTGDSYFFYHPAFTTFNLEITVSERDVRKSPGVTHENLLQHIIFDNTL